LMGLAAEVPVVVAHLGVLVIAGGEDHVELAVGIGDPPRPHGVVPVVVPDELAPDLREAPVDQEPVLGEPGPFGPLGAELQADHLVAGPTGAAAPVPADGGGPATAADV